MPVRSFAFTFALALALAVAFISVAACGDDDPGATSPDAARAADAATADGASLADAAVPQSHWFVIDAIRLPVAAADEEALGQDLDGDGAIDNWVAPMFLVMSRGDIRVAGATRAAIRQGRLIQLLGVTTASLEGTGEASARFVRGEDLDGDPDDNFSGSEAFRVVPLEGADGELAGTIEGGELNAGPGVVTLLFSFIEGAEPVALHWYAARVRISIAPDGTASGVLAAAITEAEADAVLYPWMAAAIDAIIARDCPTPNTCAEGSRGEVMERFFDDDEDGTISITELQANTAVGGRFGNPDLDVVDGDGQPGQDGIIDASSFGFGLTAVGATLVE